MIHKTVTCPLGCTEGVCIGECMKTFEFEVNDGKIPTVSLPYEVDPEKDLEYVFNMYKKSPSNSRAYKNLVEMLKAHHIRNILKKEEK